MSSNIWTEKHHIESEDVDFKADFCLSKHLEVFQRASDRDMEQLGVTRDHMIELGLGWMLITLDLELHRIPKVFEHVSVETWSKGSKGAMWQRDYLMLDEQQQETAKARSIWVLVDIEKRRIVRPSALQQEVPYNTEKSLGEPPEKVAIPEELELRPAYSMTVKYSGIDINGHLNNARYADLCYDALTADELINLEAARFQITYVHEARLDDEIIVLRSEMHEGRIYFRGEGQDGNHYFEACLTVR
ncbi:acyl-ACP thioesterase domain-containing protein [Paenibacillus sediminis]|uniref:Acyl-ACP thioesterase n=1 Tax=Paenibacillus sediminis TaxID=664909 RepID=A0ABS4H5E6_9BACL|nr:acyl-ACP thioesterase domain-containing protein [Paenibacillus sediminis]MBP1937706.1 acyl-ACP thioesterase [Paenibacillus sediminis]